MVLTGNYKIAAKIGATELLSRMDTAGLLPGFDYVMATKILDIYKDDLDLEEIESVNAGGGREAAPATP